MNQMIDPADMADIEEPEFEPPNWLVKHWPSLLLVLGGFLIGLGIGIMFLKGRCESIIDYYKVLSESCVMLK